MIADRLRSILARARQTASIPMIAVPALLTIHLFLSLSSGVHKSLTYDESLHYRYGEQILSLNSDRFDDSKMPVSALNALVVRAARDLFPARMQAIWQDIRVGRISTALFSALIGLLVYRWSSELYGPAGGIASLAIYALEPNILAHSRLITTDIFVAGMIAIAIYTFWRLLRRPSWPNALLAGSALALAQLAKYTAVFLYPLLPLLALVYYWREARDKVQTADFRALFPALRKALLTAILFATLSLLVINAGFLFNRSMTRLSGYEFRSELFSRLQGAILRAADPPVPTPYPYLEGLDWVRHRERGGDSRAGIYLLGEVRDGRGFAGYYFVAGLFKIPIVVLIAFLASSTKSVFRQGRSSIQREELFLLVPAIYFLIYFNFFFDAQIGIRLILVVFPFLIVLSGNLFERWKGWNLRRKAMVWVAGLYLLASVLSYYPHFISYFNEFVWDRKQSYRYLADSNLDFGQNKGYLAEYLADHPEAIFEPPRPTTGRIVVSVNFLSGQRGGPGQYAWLRENYEPIDHIGYAYLIYQVDELPQNDQSG